MTPTTTTARVEHGCARAQNRPQTTPRTTVDGANATEGIVDDGDRDVDRARASRASKRDNNDRRIYSRCMSMLTVLATTSL